MKVLIAPDKFKGSLTAREVCSAISEAVKDVYPMAEATSLPMADGGEGTLDILTEVLQLEQRECRVRDPLFREKSAVYGVRDHKAYIEMALASGLQLLAPEERNAMHTSSIGTGDLLAHAVDHGAKEIYLFVGGSACHDGGTGLASALGFRFLDADGQKMDPIGVNLRLVSSIQNSDVTAEFKIHLITDVKNPLLGADGAAYQYARQKGANDVELALLEEGSANLAQVIKTKIGRRLDNLPGSGAAGGMALCTLGLFDGAIYGGMDTILDLVDFHERLAESDLVITGEGKVDEQTLQGKVIHGVSHMARQHSVPVLAVCGLNELSDDQVNELGLYAVTSLKTPEISTEYCVNHAYELLGERVRTILNEFKLS